MQVEINNQVETFIPKKLEIIFENEDELSAFKRLMSYSDQVPLLLNQKHFITFSEMQNMNMIMRDINKIVWQIK